MLEDSQNKGSKSAMLQKYNPYPCDRKKERKRKKEPKTKTPRTMQNNIATVKVSRQLLLRWTTFPIGNRNEPSQFTFDEMSCSHKREKR